MSIGSFKNVEIICIRASGLLCKRPVNRSGRSEGQHRETTVIENVLVAESSVAAITT